MLNITFPEVARVLESMGSPIAAAEAHGCLAGGLCSDPNYSLERWLDEIVPDGEAESIAASDQPLSKLYEFTARALRGDQFEFSPLLPDDDEPLLARARGLSQWCQGFLFGLGTGDLGSFRELPAEVNEVVRDLTQIGRASVDAADFEENSEEDEESYAEIVEYLRAGVQTVFDEMNALRTARSKTH